MTQPLFRLKAITFDERENVETVVAVAAGACLDFVQAEAPGAKITDTSPAEVTLQVGEVMSLHRAAGSLTGNDRRYEGGSPVYDAMCHVIYSLIED
jgi:hypothetical protein